MRKIDADKLLKEIEICKIIAMDEERLKPVQKTYDKIIALVKSEPTVDDISLSIYDEEEIHHNCTVQVWKNSVTGECSVGWYKEGKE